jgi:PAS domain S-box-containing protein
MTMTKSAAELQSELEQAEQRIADLELLASREEDRFSKIFQVSPSQMALTDTATGMYVDVNQAFLQILGFRRDEVVGKTAIELNLFVHPEQRSALLQRMAAQGFLRNEYILVQAKNGEVLHGMFSAEYIYSNGQKLLLTAMNDITAVIRSEERWQLALDSAGDGAWDWNPQTNRVYYSRQWKQMLGYEPQDIGDSLAEWESRVHPDDLPAVKEKIQDHLAGKCPAYASEHRVRCKDGSYKWILDRGKVNEWTKDHKPLRVIGTHKDISERKAAEQKLQESEKRFSKVFHANPAAQMIVSIADGKIIDANRAFCQQAGFSRAEIIGRTTRELNIWADPTQQEWMIGQLREGKQVRDVEMDFRTKAGGMHTLLYSFEMVEINGARCVLSTGFDITERKVIEQALRQSENQYHSLVEALDVGICRWLPDTTLTYANGKYKQIFDLQGEALGQKWIHFVPDERRAPTAERNAEVLRQPRTVTTEYPIPAKDGSVREFQWIDTPILGESGEVTGFQSIGIDITARKKMEEDLAQSEKKYRELVQFAPLGIYEIDFRTRKLISVNDVICQTLGYSREEMLDLSPLAIMDQPSQARFNERLRRWLAGEPSDPMVEYRIRTKDGRGVDALLNVSFTRDPAGRPLGATVIAGDITERKRNEGLIAAQRDLARLNNANLSKAETYQACLQIALRVAGSDCGGFYILDEDQRVFKLVYSEGLGAQFVNAAAQYAEDTPNAQMLVSGKTLLFSEAELSRQEHHAAERLRSTAMFPIQYQGRVFGCLQVASHIHPDLPEHLHSALESILVEIGSIILHQRTEDALRTSREQLSRALVAARMGTWRWHIPSNRLDWSPEAAYIFGGDLKDNTFHSVLEQFHPDDRDRLLTAIQTGLVEKKLPQLEYRIFDRSGQIIWVTNYANIEYDPDGRPLAVTGIIQEITERKQAEQTIKENELFLKESQKIANMGSWQFDLTKSTVNWSENCYSLYGFEPGEVAPTFELFQSMVHPDDLHIVQDGLIEVLQDMRPLAQELRIIDKAGQMKWIINSMTPEVKEGQVVRLTGTQIDITARKHAEDALRESEARYRSLIDSQDSAISTIDADGTFHYINANGAAPFGSPDQVIGRRLHDLFPPQIANWQLEQVRQVVATGKGIVTEYPGELAGKKSWRRVSIQPIHNAAGSIRLATVNSLDITERKLVEQKLRESEMRYQKFISMALEAISRTEFDHPIDTSLPVEEQIDLIYANAYLAECNQAMANMYHTTLDAIIGMRMIDAHGGKNNPTNRAAFQRFILAGYQSFDNETIEYAVDGQPAWFLSNTVGVVQDGKLVRVWDTAIDITERKRAQEELRLAEQRYRALIENAPDGIVLISAQGEFRYTSPSAERLTGFNQDEMRNMGPVTLTHPDDWPMVAGELEKVRQDSAYKPTIQFRYRVKSGKWRWMECTLSNLLALPSVEAIIANFRDITERRLAEEELKKSQELLKEAQRIGRIGYMEWNLGEEDFVCSDEIYAIYDFPHGTAVSKNTISDMMLPEDLARVQKWETEAVRQRRNTNYEYHIRTRGQQTLCLHQIGIMTYSEDGTLIRRMIIVQDITERKQAETALRASEEKYRGLMESLQNAIATVDFDGRILYMNDKAAQSLGGTPQTLTGKTMRDLFPAELAAFQLAGIQRIFREDREAAFEGQSLSENGLRWYRFAFQPLHDENGQVVQVLVNATDIHDLKTTQEELLVLNRTLEERVRERTAQVQDLYDNAPVGYHSLDPEGRYAAINRTELTWLGYTREELLGKPISTIFTQPVSETFSMGFSEFKTSGRTSNQEVDVVRKDGSTFPVMINSSAIFDQNGKYVTSRSSMTDITERKRIENELKRNVNFTNAMMNAIPTPVFYKDRDGKYLGCNHAYTEFVGFTAEELYGKTALELWPGENSILAHHSDMDVMQERERQVQETTINDRNEKSRSVILVKNVFNDESGNTAGMIGAFIDITDRKQSEDILRMTNLELERAMRVKDEFLATMSHELRTPLHAILGLSESLAEQYIGPLNTRQLRSVRTIESSGRHLYELIKDILDLSKLEAQKMTLDLTQVYVKEICEASLVFIKDSALKKHFQVYSELDPAVEYVQADGLRLKQMLVNLLSNAVKFTPEGGTVTLKVNGNQNAKTVGFTVSDTGIGIAPENLPRLFQPFVQLDGGLNRQFEGTGLGLSLVARMAQLHGGSVTVDSRPGEGSNFTIFLPWENPGPPARPAVQLAEVTVDASPSVPLLPNGKTPLLLIAEDNEANIVSLSMYLQTRGYRTVIAHNGNEALTLAHLMHPDLVLMDLQMPVMDGLEAIRNLRIGNDPQLAAVPVIALTALAMPADRARSLEAGANAYLSKPVNLKELTETINGLIWRK